MSEQNEVEVKTVAGSLRARGTDVIAILVFVAVTVNAVLLWAHMEDAKAVAQSSVAVQKEMAAEIKESSRAQRLATCLAATKEDQRESEYMKQNSFCNRMAK